MKKLIFPAFAILTLCCGVANANVTVVTPKALKADTVFVERRSVQQMADAKSRADIVTVADTVLVKKGKAMIAVPDDAVYMLMVRLGSGNDNATTVFNSPGDKLTLDVKSLSPLQANITGSKFVEDLSRLDNMLNPLNKEFNELRAAQASQDKIMAVYEKYIDIAKKFIDADPTSPAAVSALLNLSGDDFTEYDKKIGDNAIKSPLYPFLDKQRQAMKRQAEAEQLRASLSEKHAQAPAFTLPNLEGKPVSLSEFKGKWVILDFWGSWCGWCIKGFPELKKAYEKYKDRLEVIGVDCQETQEAWKAGVERHNLPWVHVYLSQEQAPELLQAYGVQGFPTKVIINPEGQIMNITSGEDPAFYEALDKFMK